MHRSVYCPQLARGKLPDSIIYLHQFRLKVVLDLANSCCQKPLKPGCILEMFTPSSSADEAAWSLQGLLVHHGSKAPNFSLIFRANTIKVIKGNAKDWQVVLDLEKNSWQKLTTRSTQCFWSYHNLHRPHDISRLSRNYRCSNFHFLWAP